MILTTPRARRHRSAGVAPAYYRFRHTVGALHDVVTRAGPFGVRFATPSRRRVAADLSDFERTIEER